MTNDKIHGHALKPFTMPHYFEHLQNDTKLEVLRSDSSKGKYKTLRLMFFLRAGAGDYTKSNDIALDLEDQINLYLVISKKKNAIDSFKIERKGKSLTIEPARSNSNREPGIYFGAYSKTSTQEQQVSVNIPPFGCVFLSGIVLSCIADNMGCDTSTANNLINRWY